MGTTTEPAFHASRRREGPVTGIAVREALQLPSLAGARLLAGAAGVDRRIRSVNMMEVPDIDRWLREDELLVTTAYPLRKGARGLRELVRLLAEHGLAGLALKPGRYLSDIPPPALALAEQLAFPILELPPSAAFSDILADVLGTILNRQAIQLERSRAIHERLTAVVLAGGGLQEVIEALSQLTQTQAAIADVRGRVLAASGDGAGVEREAGTWATRPIQAAGVRHGAVVVWSPECGLARDTLVAMDHAATIAALTMTHEQAVASREQRSRARLLEDLVSGRPVDRAETLARGRSFGWDLGRPRAALRVDLASEAGEDVLVADRPLEEPLVRLVQEVAGRNAIAWGLRSGIAALVPAHPPRRLAQLGRELRAAIARRHPHLHVAVGIGRPREDLVELHHSYREAIETLALGQQLHGADAVLAYAELGLYRLLAEVPAAALEGYCVEALQPLLAADQARGGALLETLEAYLAHGRNRAATARALFVHYNTLRHRLEQIGRLLGDVDGDPHGWLRLEVAVQGRRLLAAQGRVLPLRPPQQASARPSISTRPEERPNRRRGSGSPRSSSA